MNPNQKKRVFVEDIKTHHTTHWDMDYLPRAELDALYRRNRKQRDTASAPLKWYLRRNLLKAALGVATLFLITAVTLLIIL